MLFNPAKGEPSTEGFASWLGQQEPDKKYNYTNSCVCAIGRYLKSLGVGYLEYERRDPGLMTWWNLMIASPPPWTFGAAAERARKHLKEIV